jgi:hypothetical protein
MSELEEKKKRKKAGTESSKESSLRDWFKRKGAKGSKGGWVDCNAPDGKGGYKSCGRSSGEKRKKYPACRPTPGACKERGRGKSWGKKGSKKKKNESIKLTNEQLSKIIKEELKAVLTENPTIDKLESLWQEEHNWDQVYYFVTSVREPDIDMWYRDKINKLDQEVADSLREVVRLKKERRKVYVKHQRALEDEKRYRHMPYGADAFRQHREKLYEIGQQTVKAEKALESARKRRSAAKNLPESGSQTLQ